MKDDYNTNSRYLTYAFCLWKVGRMYFLSSGVKGLIHVCAAPGISQYRSDAAWMLTYAVTSCGSWGLIMGKLCAAVANVLFNWPWMPFSLHATVNSPSNQQSAYCCDRFSSNSRASWKEANSIPPSRKEWYLRMLTLWAHWASDSSVSPVAELVFAHDNMDVWNTPGCVSLPFFLATNPLVCTCGVKMFGNGGFVVQAWFTVQEVWADPGWIFLKKKFNISPAELQSRSGFWPPLCGDLCWWWPCINEGATPRKTVACEITVLMERTPGDSGVRKSVFPDPMLILKRDDSDDSCRSGTGKAAMTLATFLPPNVMVLSSSPKLQFIAVSSRYGKVIVSTQAARTELVW